MGKIEYSVPECKGKVLFEWQDHNGEMIYACSEHQRTLWAFTKALQRNELDL